MGGRKADVTVDVSRARENWHRVKTVATGASVLAAFKTLRDMHSDTVVDFTQLQIVGPLGEGAYGTVERGKQINPDGSIAYVAIKRLKRQDLTEEIAEHSGSTYETLDDVLPQITRLAAVARDLDASDTDGKCRQEAQVRDIMSHLSELRAVLQDDQLFLAEISVMKRLSHPYIIRYLGCGIIQTHQGRYLSIAQEVCEGGELGRMVERASWSRRGKRLYAFKDAARWSEQAAKALHYLHSAQPQVLHRDVKTSNLLLTEPGRHGNIRLCDFGLTKLRKIAKMGFAHAIEEDVKYVMTGETGSLLYMAPEVYNGEPYSEKVDIFSLGVVIFELFSLTSLNGLVGSSGDDDACAQYARRVAAGHREAVPQTWPQGLKDLVTACWSQEPSARPSAYDVVCRLQCMQGDIAALDAKCPRGVAGSAEPRRASGKFGRFFKALRRR